MEVDEDLRPGLRLDLWGASREPGQEVGHDRERCRRRRGSEVTRLRGVGEQAQRRPSASGPVSGATLATISSRPGSTTDDSPAQASSAASRSASARETSVPSGGQQVGRRQK